MLAERVGFEPTCPLRDKTLSRRPRYDHFGTSPNTLHYTHASADSAPTPGATGAPPGAEELLHQLAALGLQNARRHCEPVIQAGSLEGAKRGHQRPGLRLGRAIHDLAHARVHQRAHACVVVVGDPVTPSLLFIWPTSS